MITVSWETKKSVESRDFTDQKQAFLFLNKLKKSGKAWKIRARAK